MNSETIVYCVVALILGMLMAHMLKSVCGCKTVEGTYNFSEVTWDCGDLQWWRVPGALQYRANNCTEMGRQYGIEYACKKNNDCKPGRTCNRGSGYCMG